MSIHITRNGIEIERVKLLTMPAGCETVKIMPDECGCPTCAKRSTVAITFLINREQMLALVNEGKRPDLLPDHSKVTNVYDAGNGMFGVRAELEKTKLDQTGESLGESKEEFRERMGNAQPPLPLHPPKRKRIPCEFLGSARGTA